MTPSRAGRAAAGGKNSNGDSGGSADIAEPYRKKQGNLFFTVKSPCYADTF
jgi:hypothetical protein